LAPEEEAEGGMLGSAMEAEGAGGRFRRLGSAMEEAKGQGLTIVHFSAQSERSLWDRGCA